MRSLLLRFSVLAALCAVVVIVGMALADTPKPSAPAVGELAKIDVGARPPGRIAFLKDGDVWIMDSDGKNRQKICAVTNARGRVSFSPDNSIIAFSREGRDASKLPTNEGGAHLLHDVFLAYIDSAATNPSWWLRVTDGLGGYYPEWSANDSIIYYQNDINANDVDYIVPSHQLARVNIVDGHKMHVRKDWQMLNTWMLTPSVTRDGGKVAYVISYSKNPDQYVFSKVGIKILDMADIMIPEDQMRKPTKGLENTVAPSWSPDGKWLAYISDDMRDPGIFLISSDLKETRQIFASTVTQQVSPEPVGWAPNSKWITFATMDGVIYVMDINGGNLTALTGTGNNSNPAWSH